MKRGENQPKFNNPERVEFEQPRVKCRENQSKFNLKRLEFELFADESDFHIPLRGWGSFSIVFPVFHVGLFMFNHFVVRVHFPSQCPAFHAGLFMFNHFVVGNFL